MSIQTWNFDYKGSVQTLQPSKGVYSMECWGASGSDGTSSTRGKGGYAKGVFCIEGTETLYVYVGGKGIQGGNAWIKGGYNGGGGVYSQNKTVSGGGGATDISLVGGENSYDSKYTSVRATASYNARLIVAGGGGGGGQSNSSASHGGGTTGTGDTSRSQGKVEQTGHLTGIPGHPGTQTNGGNISCYQANEVSNSRAGGFGYGGTYYALHASNTSTGGGGGGWYGGGCSNHSGGGGGSGYVVTSSSTKPSGYTVTSKHYATSTQLISGNSSMPNPSGGTMTGKDGNGYARIMLLAVQPTISIKSKSNTQVVVTFNYNSTRTDKSKTLRVNWGGTWTTLNTTSASAKVDQDITYNLPVNTDGHITFEVNNGDYTTSLNLNIDNKPPVISFPTETYSTQHYEGETVTLFTASDTNDKTLDWDYKVYIDDTLYSSYTMVNHNTLKLPYFENMPESYQLRVEVRARQSADTTNGTTQDIWSEWYTSPTITIKSPVLFIPNFTSIKWYQDVEQPGIISPFTEFETQHWCNGELYTTKRHLLGITPPLLYTPIKPHLWVYEYYAVTRVKVEGQWSGWYKSPTVEVQFNVQPNDIEFNKKLPPYLVQGEIITVEWAESLDPNSTKTTYTVSLMNDVTEEIFEYTGVTENRLTFTTPRDILSDKVTFNVVAYSDGLYSNLVSSPQFAITDVKVMDCTLDFPRLTTNVLGEFKKLTLEINNDRRVEFEDNLDNYLLPLHYFRKGENILTLIATDRNDVEVTRSWKITLDFNLQDLEQINTIDLKGYMSFNHNESEQYVPCTTLFKPNLDLGVVEHELYGSTTFEGVDSITQKLVITRDANDDISQLRTLKITGAIE